MQTSRGVFQPILTRLSEKARYALSAVAKDADPLPGGSLWNIKQEDTDDELSIFAGHTRFVFSKKPHQSSNRQPGFKLFPKPPPLAQIQGQSSPPHMGSHQQRSPTECQAPVMDYDLPVQLAPVQPPPPPPMMNNWPSQGRPDNSGLISIEPMEEHLRFPFMSCDRTRSGGHSITQDDVPWREQQSQSYRHHDPQPTPTSATSSMGFPSPTSPSSNQHVFGPSHGQHRYSSVNPYPPPSTAPDKQTRPVPRHRTPRQLLTPDESSYPRYPQGFQQPPLNMQSQLGQQQQHQHQHPQQQQQQQQNYALNGLADLGLAARDSRLDERWGSFMEHSGLLEGIDFRG